MRSIGLALLLMLLGGVSDAEEATQSEAETIRQLVEQVQQLQAKVEALESKENARAASAGAPSDATGPATEAVKTGTADEHSTSPLEELHDARGIQWRGFGEVDYKALNQRNPGLGTYGFVAGSAGNFYTGDFTLLLTSKINDKASVLSEMVIEEGEAQSYGINLERVLLKYDYNDHLKFSFGRYHTNIGYYNTAYHSGAWLQTAADRPEILDFANDGGPLPTQAVGVSVTGTVPSEKLGLNYIFEYGSSDTKSPNLNGIGFDDENNGNHVNAGLFARPETVPGLQVGGSVYHDKISQFTRGPNVRLGQTIVNGHVVYEAHGWELLNEGFLIRHSYEQLPIIYNMPAMYSQVSKRFHKVRPYFRYQYTNANPGSILADHGLRYGPSFGARYDLDDYIAFKVQLDRIAQKGQPDVNGLHMQLAYTF